MRCRLLQVLILAGCLASLLINPAQAQPRRYALVVGVKEYPVSEKLPNLTHTEADAHLLGDTLTKSGYQVTLMTKTAGQGDGEGRFLPVAALIRKRFDALVKTPFLKPEDCLVVTLAGHGIQLPSQADPEKKTYYFCPSDALIDQLKFSEDVQDRHNLISIQELYDTLEKSGAGVKLLAVDACRNDPNKPPIARAANSVTRPPVPIPPGGIAAYFSCSSDQESIEDAALKHGVFTWYLNEALSGKGDTNGDQKITLAEIKEYVGLNVYTFVDKKYGRSQLPEMEDKTRGFAAIVEIPRLLIPLGTKAGEVRTVGGIQFCWCPPGKFTMGSPKSQIDALLQADASLLREFFDNEAPVDVTLSSGFWLGQTEVTQAEYEAILGATPWKGEGFVKEGDNYPACYVNWEDASDFCVKLTAQGHQEGWLPKDWQFDLPTEAQWEYACRAGTGSRYSFGDDETKLSEFAWWGGFLGGNTKTEQYAHQVGLKKPNRWQLHDMHGNVYELCRDRYLDKLPGGTDPVVQEKAPARVFRGGSWGDFFGDCRSATRGGVAPDLRNFGLGFRLALIQTR